MKILITGGAGFIGGHLAQSLAPHEISILDRAATGASHGRVEHFENCWKALEGIDLVMHLAASTDVRTANRDSFADLLSACGTLNLLEAMKTREVKDIVFASSGAIYGEGDFLREEHRLTSLPISLYGASKLYGESLISAFCSTHGFRGIALRLGNVIGSDRKQGVIFDFLKQIQETGRLTVLGNGSQAKSYIHVDDAVEGFRQAAGILRTEQDGFFETYNLTGEGVARVDEIAKLCAKSRPIVFGTSDRGWPGDVPLTALSPDKFARRGFRTKLSSLRAVRRVIEEMLAHAS